MAKRTRKVSTYDEPLRIPPIVPKTAKQNEYLDALRVSPQVFAIGPAGTGKTWLPTAYAADLLRQKQIDKIVLTRPNVPAGPTLGFFPGTLEEKMAPWVVPFIEVIKERLGGPSQLEAELKRNNIEIAPFETMRGRTFFNSVVIVDEAQNLTESEMYMVLTRIGEESQLIINGDLIQLDIKKTSGLAKAIDTIREKKINAAVIEFTKDDVVRGGICAEWVKAW